MGEEGDAIAKRDTTRIRKMTADVSWSAARCARCIVFYSYQTSCNTSTASLRNQLSHLCVARSRQVAGKCNAPGCTKVTKCHLLKATRCAPLQASSRRPVCNYMFLFSFLLSSLSLHLLLHYLATTGPYVRSLKTSVRPAIWSSATDT